MSYFLLFIKWRKEKEREEDEETVTELSSAEFEKCIALVLVKGMLVALVVVIGCRHWERQVGALLPLE